MHFVVPIPPHLRGGSEEAQACVDFCTHPGPGLDVLELVGRRRRHSFLPLMVATSSEH